MQHIAILRKKYYDMVISGEKTIESRFSMNKIAPYNKINVGDILWIKETGKDVTLKVIVDKVKFYELTPEIVEKIRINYGKEIGTDKPQDWTSTLQKKYGTLIWLKNIERIEPKKVKRSNGAGWIVVDKID